MIAASYANPEKDTRHGFTVSERRTHFFINKPFQTKFMVYFTGTLALISSILIISLYFGIWGGLLDAFSNDKVRTDLLMAARLSEYEAARVTPGQEKTPLSFFSQSEKLTQRQQEIFKEILDDTNRKLLPKLFLVLILIAWASIFLSHKIAGPLYRFYMGLDEIQKGNLKARIKLRKHDEARSLEKKFNETAETLDQTFTRLKNMAQESNSDPTRLTARLKEELSKIKTSADL
jgi:methyl-accepting chemotaxis protein